MVELRLSCRQIARELDDHLLFTPRSATLWIDFDDEFVSFLNRSKHSMAADGSEVTAQVSYDSAVLRYISRFASLNITLQERHVDQLGTLGILIEAYRTCHTAPTPEPLPFDFSAKSAQFGNPRMYLIVCGFRSYFKKFPWNYVSQPWTAKQDPSADHGGLPHSLKKAILTCPEPANPGSASWLKAAGDRKPSECQLRLDNPSGLIDLRTEPATTRVWYPPIRGSQLHIMPSDPVVTPQNNTFYKIEWNARLQYGLNDPAGACTTVESDCGARQANTDAQNWRMAQVTRVFVNSRPYQEVRRLTGVHSKCLRFEAEKFELKASRPTRRWMGPPWESFGLLLWPIESVDGFEYLSSFVGLFVEVAIRRSVESTSSVAFPYRVDLYRPVPCICLS